LTFKFKQLCPLILQLVKRASHIFKKVGMIAETMVASKKASHWSQEREKEGDDGSLVNSGI